MSLSKQHRVPRIPAVSKKELKRGVLEMRSDAEFNQDWMVACAKDEAATLLAREDAGFSGWPAKPQSPSEVLTLTLYVNECRNRRHWHLFDAAALAERIRFLSRFLKRSHPMIQLANHHSKSP